MKRFVIVATLLGALAGGGVALVACDGDDATPRANTTLAEPGEAIGEELMLALAQAKNFHHQARVYSADGQPLQAIAAIERVLAIQFPPGAPEGEDVRLDAYAMLAKLRLGQGDLEAAMKVIDEGVDASTRDSFFLANLYTVRGEVLEAVAADHVARNETARASEVHKQAIEAYATSIEINERLQQALYERIKRGQAR
jgi:tetratricopeptide (TPR) repeat protein